MSKHDVQRRKHPEGNSLPPREVSVAATKHAATGDGRNRRVSPGRLRYLAQEALKRLFEPGGSCHRDKRLGIAGQKIRSIHTMRTHTRDVGRFVKWCHRRNGVRSLAEITPEMAREYIDELHDRELSGGYIGRVVATIRKLDVALHGRERPQDAPPLLEGGGFHPCSSYRMKWPTGWETT